MKFIYLGIAISLASPSASAAPVTLFKAGTCRTAIHVPPRYMDPKGPSPKASRDEIEREPGRVRVRESVKDLAAYLGKITGTTVAIYPRPPKVEDKLIPILIGSYGDKMFGPFTMKSGFKQGYRFVVAKNAVGMQGETDEGISYAIYELLDGLGCRWYVPGDLGEVIPSMKTITLAERDIKQVPGTVSRGVWFADDAFKRRNRLGGFAFTAGHALEGYITKAQLEKNPDWNAEIGGKRALHKCDVGYRLCWGNPNVSAAVAAKISADLNQRHVPCVSISPGDGIDFCECARCKKLDTGDWDPSMSRESITDRYVHFANQIAASVAKKHPDVKLGFLAYVQFTRPPLREKLHPALIPQLAPITYCRAHALDDPTCESRAQIRGLLEGWGKVSKNIAMYEYYFHLAEVAAPFPAIRRNVVELPVQFANNVTMWTPETLPNFESFTPGLHLGIRMSWYSKANPRDVLTEFYTTFYGGAAKPMGDYWQHIDDCWTKVPEHAGCGFSYMRRFTPERMATARKKMDAALSACKTPMETRRVKFADDSLRQHELFMKIRRDYFAGRFANLGADSDRWIKTHQALAEKYKENFSFTKTGYAPQTISVSYFNAFYNNSYKDVARIGKDFAIVTPPLLTWSYAVDKKKQGQALNWQKPGLADKDWKKTDVSTQTWATLGLDRYFGPVWYRTQVKLPAIPTGKKVYLWIGATDGACKVFVNGEHVPHVDAKGKKAPEANGYCDPFSFDITRSARSNGNNQITIVGTRTFLNELGIGGLLGPVLVYREK
ncbi:MAG: DUF4838 domain-containing protein [Planctomycetes bacterium]|nr:DUF4838 domain-containing protein [Planctomycetota bacterium]